MIRKVEVHNNDGKKPYATAHWIEADTEENILRIVKKYNINNPVGRELINPELILVDNDFLYDFRPIKIEFQEGIFRPRSFFRGKVWFEKAGELCAIPIKKRYSQMMKETDFVSYEPPSVYVKEKWNENSTKEDVINDIKEFKGI